LESIVAGTIRKGSFGIDWGPGLITKQFTSTHVGFEQNQYVKNGSGQKPFWKASLPERFEKVCLGLIGARAGYQKVHIDTHRF